MTVEEIRGNTSDQPLKHQQGSESQEYMYEDIILQPRQQTLELQCNMRHMQRLVCNIIVHKVLINPK